MIVENITLKNYRNIESADVRFCNRFNLFYGANGQGKTNFLEAIFFLGTLKSFRHAKNAEMITWNTETSLITAVTLKDRIKHDLSISFEAHGKQLYVDSKPVSKIADYCSNLSVVAFSPEELLMVAGTPEQRRRYLDRAIFSNSPSYLRIYQDYHRVLKHRNHLLKQQSYAEIEAWSEQLVITGTKLIASRNDFVKNMKNLFSLYYQSISGSDEHGELCYYANSLIETNDIETIAADFRIKLSENQKFERERSTTMIGPHRDDLGFFLDGKLIRQHGSQGQQKSFVLALKMAEIELLNKTSGVLPVLLLDDMSAELDKQRVGHLLDFLLERDIQVFITTTDPTEAKLPDTAKCESFLVKNGRIVQ